MNDSELFSLEALEAMEGDALLLHYGSAAAPKLILVDGGPSGIYKSTLKERLARIGERLNAVPLELRHTFVTHLDSDHIRGVLGFAKDMSNEDCPAQCNSFWLNAFDETLLAQLPPATAAAMHDVPAPRMQVDRASINDGMNLMDAITTLKAGRNGGAPMLIATGEPTALDLGEPELEVTLVCTDIAQLRKLADEWEKTLEKTTVAKADYVDRSVFNLSSLVLVVQARHADGRRARVLLTGDHIIAGVRDAELLDENGHVHFDVLKLPHHGSGRNLRLEFFQAIQAGHYVISANGRFGNPSVATLEWIDEAAEDDGYVLWLTNRTSSLQEALAKNVAAAPEPHPRFHKHLRYREENAPSVMIDVFAQVEYQLARRTGSGGCRTGRSAHGLPRLS